MPIDASIYFVRLIVFDPSGQTYNAGYVVPCDSRLVDATGSVSDKWIREGNDGGGIVRGTTVTTFQAWGPNYVGAPVTLGTSTAADTWGSTDSDTRGFNDTFPTTMTDVNHIIPAGNIIRAANDGASVTESNIRLIYLLTMSRHSRN